MPESNYFLACSINVRRMHAEHSTPPYGLSGRFSVFGIDFNARGAVAFIPCSTALQLEQCALLGLRKL